MTDIRRPRVLYFKAGLFVCIGVIASALLILDHPQVKTVALLTLTVWAFARAYYFAFYVIQHYIDPSYRFAGLIDFCRYLVRSSPSPRTRRD